MCGNTVSYATAQGEGTGLHTIVRKVAGRALLSVDHRLQTGMESLLRACHRQSFGSVMRHTGRVRSLSL